MPVSGLVVEVTPGAEASLAEQVESLAGEEVSQVGAGAIIVTTDTATVKEDEAVTARLGSLPGVLTVKVAFSSMEDCTGDDRS